MWTALAKVNQLYRGSFPVEYPFVVYYADWHGDETLKERTQNLIDEAKQGSIKLFIEGAPSFRQNMSTTCNGIEVEMTDKSI